MGAQGRPDARNALSVMAMLLAVFGLMTLLFGGGSDAPSESAAAVPSGAAAEGDATPNVSAEGEPSGAASSSPGAASATAGAATPAPAADGPASDAPATVSSPPATTSQRPTSPGGGDPGTPPSPSPQPPVDDGTNDGATDVGVTEDDITIFVVVADSGPVPPPGGRDAAGLAMEAFVAHVNEELGPIHGRRLNLEVRDGRMDPGMIRQAHREACADGFAIVGSGNLESVGSPDCGIPQLLASTWSSGDRRGERVFSVKAFHVTAPSMASWAGWAEREPEAVAEAAWVQFGNSDALDEHRDAVLQATTALGYRWREPVAPLPGSLNPYEGMVQALQDDGIEFVRLEGSSVDIRRFADAMARRDYRPTLVTLDESAMDVAQQTDAPSMQGFEVATDLMPLVDASASASARRYVEWLQRVHPSFEPSARGLRSWVAGEAFVDGLRDAGGWLDREVFAQELAARTAWSSDAFRGARPLQGEFASDCLALLRIERGAWARAEEGRGLSCTPPA